VSLQCIDFVLECFELILHIAFFLPLLFRLLLPYIRVSAVTHPVALSDVLDWQTGHCHCSKAAQDDSEMQALSIIAVRPEQKACQAQADRNDNLNA
jgi:hypothetical protein